MRQINATISFLVLIFIVPCSLSGFLGWYMGGLRPQTANNTTVAPLSEIQQIKNVTKNFCQAQVDESGNQLSFLLGTIGSGGKSALFSNDKRFASVNVRCSSEGAPGGGIGYILKKVNGDWIVVSQGTQADPTAQKLYAIPQDFN